MEWTVILRKDEYLHFGFILYKESRESGLNVYDVTLFSNRLLTQLAHELNEYDIYEKLSQGRGFWFDTNSLLESVNTVRDFWMENHIRELPAIFIGSDIQAVEKMISDDIDMIVYKKPDDADFKDVNTVSNEEKQVNSHKSHGMDTFKVAEVLSKCMEEMMQDSEWEYRQESMEDFKTLLANIGAINEMMKTETCQAVRVDTNIWSFALDAMIELIEDNDLVLINKTEAITGFGVVLKHKEEK